jgi:hypothetical protein
VPGGAGGSSISSEGLSSSCIVKCSAPRAGGGAKCSGPRSCDAPQRAQTAEAGSAAECPTTKAAATALACATPFRIDAEMPHLEPELRVAWASSKLSCGMFGVGGLCGPLELGGLCGPLSVGTIGSLCGPLPEAGEAVLPPALPRPGAAAPGPRGRGVLERGALDMAGATGRATRARHASLGCSR